MSSTRLTDQLAGWMKDSIERHSLGEEVTYDLFVMIDANGGFQFFFSVGMSSLILGKKNITMAAVPLDVAYTINEATIDEMILHMINNIKDTRSKQASESIDSEQSPSFLVNGNTPR